jgi:hypothetical protein
MAADLLPGVRKTLQPLEIAIMETLWHEADCNEAVDAVFGEADPTDALAAAFWSWDRAPRSSATARESDDPSELLRPM